MEGGGVVVVRVPVLDKTKRKDPEKDRGAGACLKQRRGTVWYTVR